MQLIYTTEIDGSDTQGGANEKIMTINKRSDKESNW